MKKFNKIYNLLFHNYIIVIAFILISFILKIFLTQTDGYLNADAFAYLVKTKEIILGDWRPIKSHSFGLSIVSSIFLFPFIDKNYVDLAYYAKLLNKIIEL